MPKSRDQLFETLTTEGALLPSDFLQRLAQRDREVPGLTPDAYHLGSGERINEAVSRSWNRLLAVWKNFAVAVGQLPESDLGTTLTREKWLLPFFQELGHRSISTTPAGAVDAEHRPVRARPGGDLGLDRVGRRRRVKICCVRGPS